MNEERMARSAAGVAIWIVLVLLAIACGLSPFAPSTLAVISIMMVKISR